MDDSAAPREERQMAEPGAFATSNGDQYRPGGEESFPGSFDMYTGSNASVGHYNFVMGAASGYPNSQSSEIQESSQTQSMPHNPSGSDQTNSSFAQPFNPNIQDAQTAAYLENMLRVFLQQAPPPPALPDLEAYFAQFSHNMTDTMVAMFEALVERLAPALPNPPSSDDLMRSPDSSTAGIAVPVPSAPSTTTPQPSASPPADMGPSVPPAPTSPVVVGKPRAKITDERAVLLVRYFYSISFLPSLTTIAGPDICCYEGIRL